jgi:hypothetical protein
VYIFLHLYKSLFYNIYLNCFTIKEREEGKGKGMLMGHTNKRNGKGVVRQSNHECISSSNILSQVYGSVTNNNGFWIG